MKPARLKILLLFAFTWLIIHPVLAQETYRIQIVRAGAMAHNKYIGENIVRAIGNPVFEHAGAYLYCDSAWLDEVTNNLDCYGNVRIKSSDTLNLYGKFLHYEGNTKIARISDNVRLVDNQTTLTTNYLIFDRNTQIAYYNTGGKVVNKNNTLTSKKGDYHTDKKVMYFKEDVVMKNPDYTIHCDTMKYNTQNRVSYFEGPTIIQGKKSYLYCENGEYNSITGQSAFSENALLVDEGRRLTGDSLYYNEVTYSGKAVKNIILTDTAQDLMIKGNFAEYFKKKGFAMITDSAVAMLGDTKDTLFLHADTLRAIFDTVKQESRELMAFHNTRFYRTDLQGVCDSLHFSFPDSLITMYRVPILWSEKNQITADTIYIVTGKNTVKTVHMNISAFIISQDSSLKFNQVKGKKMTGYLTDNKLYRIDVDGNAETVYYVREDDESLIGINKAAGSRMRIYMDKDSKIERITYFDKPDGNLFPEKNIPESDQILKGFKWFGDLRPVDRNDIFRK